MPEPYSPLLSDYQSIVDRFGEWSAMSIKLPGGKTTRAPAEDPRLLRLLQSCVDILGKPLSECRVADLACLEFQYGIEFALHGAAVIGLELREANLEKAAYSARALGLTKTTLFQDDVMNFTRESYGEFDVIICSGILYHLPGPEPLKLLRQMAEACRGILLLDTFVSMRPTLSVDLQGRVFHGSSYREHDEESTQSERLRDLWASVDNTESQWYSEPSLVDAAQLAGFTTMARVLLPSHPGVTDDRRTYVCVKGTRPRVLSSDATDAMSHNRPLEYDDSRVHSSQRPKSLARRVARRLAPSFVLRFVRRYRSSQHAWNRPSR